MFGVLAQLVERLNGIEEVRGSNPLGSSLRSQRSGERRPWRRRLDENGPHLLGRANATSYGLAGQTFG